MPPLSIPADARRSLFVYNLFFPLVFAFLLPGFLLRMLRRGGYRNHFGQRLGFYSAKDKRRIGAPGRLWIHSISVGETLIALKLARQIHEQQPEVRLILSTTTTTGFALAQDASADWLEPLYNPVDFLPVIRRALDTLRPSTVALIEGEAWPNLLAECRKRAIPVALVNARLSPRSERRFARSRFWTGPIFRLLKFVAAPDPEDVARLGAAGLPAESMHVTGNIKFDQLAGSPDSRSEAFRVLAKSAGVEANTPVFLAGSTFPGEETIVAGMLPDLRRNAPGLVLLIAPRHVERIPEIAHELEALHLRVVRRSSLPLPSPVSCDVLLIDSTGELRDWYALATVVFIGKSLAAIGGQNPAEAVMLGKPVVFGPRMENFTALASHLVARGAAIRVEDAAGLKEEVAALLHDRARRETIAEKSKGALASHQGATRRTAQLLLRLIATAD